MEKIDFKITHQCDEVEMSAKDRENILSFIRWDTIPPFKDAGRTSWYVLKEPAFARSNPDRPLKAAKLKGVGLWNPTPKTKNYFEAIGGLEYIDTPIPPTTTKFTRRTTYPHFAISSEGEYCIKNSKVAPIGGILHSRSVAEYTNASILSKHNVPTIQPFMVAEYDPAVYQFDQKSMGVAVCLSPATDNMRICNVIYGRTIQRGKNIKEDSFYDNIRDVLGVSGDPMSEVTRLKTVNKMARRLGKSIHDFSASGLYRYSSGWDNFEFDLNKSQIVLTDLDSTRQLEELIPVCRNLEVMRDLVSASYRLVQKLNHTSVLGYYTTKNLLFHNPLREFLMGYFPQENYEKLTEISKSLWNYYIPHLMLMTKHQAAIRNEWSEERRNSLKVDHDLFYIMALTLLYPLFQKTALFQQYPCDLTLEDLEKKAENYLGKRYEYYCYLLDRNRFFDKPI